MALTRAFIHEMTLILLIYIGSEKGSWYVREFISIESASELDPSNVKNHKSK